MVPVLSACCIALLGREEAKDGGVELSRRLEVRQMTAVGQDQAPGTRHASLDGAAVSMHVSDVMLTRDDQRGDGYLAQACERGRFRCPVQVPFRAQVARVRGKQRSQPRARSSALS